MEVICHLYQPQKKTFLANKVTRIEDNDWELSQVSLTQGMFVSNDFLVLN
jgi:hypothetical protein